MFYVGLTIAIFEFLSKQFQFFFVYVLDYDDSMPVIYSSANVIS